MNRSLWSLRIALAKLRPVGLSLLVRGAVVAGLLALFLWGDYALFRRLFSAVASVESLTPFFAAGLIENLLGMVFLTATTVLFFSALTVGIGAFFSDLDLEIYHAAPVPKIAIIVARWLKSAVASCYLVVIFLVPMFVALAAQYGKPWPFLVGATLRLLLLVITPLNLAITAIVLTVRLFPVRRVHQVAVTLAILTLSVAVVGFRMSRPERLFQSVSTDDVVAVLGQLQLPSSEYLPGSWLAAWIGAALTGTADPIHATLRLTLLALLSFILFLAVASFAYFPAFVKARETMAPSALGAGSMTRLLDKLLARSRPELRAMVGKEIRVVTRDAAQWSQLFMMLALLFIYLYNIRMLPLSGDVRAILVAYVNVGMAGFVIAAISLRFAFPSISAEGKAFWLLETSPISFATLVRVKVFVYAAPLLLLSTFLTVAANLLLDAPASVWLGTITGSAVMTVTLVALGVGMGGWAPDFASENPLQVGLSLGGFAYMAISLIYVGAMMILVARPIHRLLFRLLFGLGDESSLFQRVTPLLLAAALSIVLSTVPLAIAARQLTRRFEK